MADPKASGELLALILDRVEETAKDVKVLSAQHAATQLSLNDGSHVMHALRKDVDGLVARVGDIERRIPTPTPFHPQASHSLRTDDERTPPSRTRREQEPRTDAITKGLNTATLIKIGMLIGAIAAGYTAAAKLIPTGGTP